MSQNVEVIDRFNYLGVVLSHRRSFIQAAQMLAGNALQATKSLFRIVRVKQVSVNIIFNLLILMLSQYLTTAVKHGDLGSLMLWREFIESFVNGLLMLKH